MIHIDEEKCTACKLCVKICHERCIELVNKKSGMMLEFDHSVCSRCAQCVAICPRQALSWNQTAPVRFDRRNLPGADQLEELLKERRTTRRFKPKPIDKQTLEKIAEIGKCAPTNHYDLRVVFVDDPRVMSKLDEIIMRDVRWLFGLFFRSDFIFNILASLTPKIDRKLRAKMIYGIREGTGMPTLPATIALVVGDRRVVLSEVSAHYALYTMILYAQALGIGSRINASGLMTLDRSKEIRKLLKLRQHENILAMVEMGYPAVKFSNKVEGRSLPVQWNGEVSNGH